MEPTQTMTPPHPQRPLPRPLPKVSSAVVGLQWGDEGKGKIVDLLAPGHDAVVRYNGGANAGHSVVVDGQRYSLHLIPSGILYPRKLAVIGNGVVVDPDALVREIEALEARGVSTRGLVVSSRAHVVMPYHIAEDQRREEILRGAGAQQGSEIGTTKRGIGPCYAEKAQRAGAVRMGDLLRPEALRERLAVAVPAKRLLAGLDDGLSEARLLETMTAFGDRLRDRIVDTAYLLNDLVRQGKRLLFEGGNATLLDVDHGTFPYVTSSACSALGIAQGTGVSSSCIERVVGVMKVYTTRVGRGPMPTELTDALGDAIRERGREYGTTTGRPRRVGWLDLVALRYSIMLNGVTSLAVTMLDVFSGFESLMVCTKYRTPEGETDRFLPDAYDLARASPVYVPMAGFAEDVSGATSRGDLPGAARRYLDFIEDFVETEIEWVSVGPERRQTIHR